MASSKLPLYEFGIEKVVRIFISKPYQQTLTVWPVCLAR